MQPIGSMYGILTYLHLPLKSTFREGTYTIPREGNSVGAFSRLSRWTGHTLEEGGTMKTGRALEHDLFLFGIWP